MGGASCAPAVVRTSGARPKRGTARFGVVCVKNAFGVGQVDVRAGRQVDKTRSSLLNSTIFSAPMSQVEPESPPLRPTAYGPVSAWRRWPAARAFGLIDDVLVAFWWIFLKACD